MNSNDGSRESTFSNLQAKSHFGFVSSPTTTTHCRGIQGPGWGLVGETSILLLEPHLESILTETTEY